MSEEEWLTGTHPRTLAEFACKWASQRKLRLFLCACCRQAWNPFVPPFTAGAVAVAEAFADGEVSDRVLARVRAAAHAAATQAAGDAPNRSGYLANVAASAASACQANIQIDALRSGCGTAARAAADLPAGVDPVTGTGWPWPRDQPSELMTELVAQADLLRDILGNPFREVEVDPAWLTSDVVALARGIYADRAFDRMPILADALQDAGCDDEDVLSHCREARDHARGCWVVDLLLGKK